MRRADYDAPMEMMIADGTEDTETQKSDIEIAKRMLNIQTDVASEQIFDFRLTARFTRNCATWVGGER